MEDLLTKVESLKSLLVSKATGHEPSDTEYQGLRMELINNPIVNNKLPRFVKSYRTLDEFWGFIQPKFAQYRQRRAFLQDEFDPLLTFLEQSTQSPSDQIISETLTKIDSASVQAAWHKALERRTTDPEGAITSARTLLEAVCKHILDEEKIAYSDKDDLPKLYGLAAKHLNLSPSQHTEKLFKQILGGCHAVVEGLGALRNKLSDAHARGKTAVHTLPRHAELAVNLAGTMATFIFATWEQKRFK
jgi:uncharacterized protein YfkK (UPF0435 family)